MILTRVDVPSGAECSVLETDAGGASKVTYGEDATDDVSRPTPTAVGEVANRLERVILGIDGVHVPGQQQLQRRLRTNGEVKVVPASQTETDDFPAYSDAVRGLFGKLSSVLAGKDDPWIKSAATADNINAQLSATKTVLQSCK